MRVLHTTVSPLAGAPSDLIRALNGHSEKVEAFGISFSSDGGSAMLREFVPAEIALGTGETFLSQLAECLEMVSIVHVHNVMPHSLLSGLSCLSKNSCPRIVLHHHSPFNERPYYMRETSPYHQVDAEIIVPHFHPRQFSKGILLPHILPFVEVPEISSLPNRLLFSPSNSTGGRWNSKSSPRQELELKRLGQRADFEVVKVERLDQEILRRLRSYFTFNLDEVVTGGYHLVSLEAIMAGSIALNAADDVSLRAFQIAYRTEESPPFVRCDVSNLSDVVSEIISDSQFISELRQVSKTFAQMYMAPGRLVKFYEEFYANLL